jgi:hypothetical protein
VVVFGYERVVNIMDIKDKVLLAIYNEYQNEVPDMEHNITWEKIETDKERFDIAFGKLENESLINGQDIRKNGHNEILMVFVKNVKPSMRGIVYVEEKLLHKTGYLRHCEREIEDAERRIAVAKKGRELGIIGDAVDGMEEHAKKDKDIYERIYKKILDEESK